MQSANADPLFLSEPRIMPAASSAKAVAGKFYIAAVALYASDGGILKPWTLYLHTSGRWCTNALSSGGGAHTGYFDTEADARKILDKALNVLERHSTFKADMTMDEADRRFAFGLVDR